VLQGAAVVRPAPDETLALDDNEQSCRQIPETSALLAMRDRLAGSTSEECHSSKLERFGHRERVGARHHHQCSVR